MDDSIVFIKLTDDMKRDINGFTVDPAVPLPVEKLPVLPEGGVCRAEVILGTRERGREA